MPPAETKDCQGKACSLQTCLNKNTYAPDKCDKQLFALYECCENLYRMQSSGTQIDQTSCPQEAVVKRWLKRRREN